jgi:hypothetical protein
MKDQLRLGLGPERYRDMVDPVLAALANAPIYDEEISEEEERELPKLANL